MALALAQQGVQVGLLARSVQPLEALAQQIALSGGKALALSADLTQPAACQQAVDQLVRQYGKLDFLINNAGIGRMKDIHQLNLEDWEQSLSTNLSAVFYMVKAALPYLSQGSYIVNVGSMAAKNAFAGGVAYNASKYGLLGLTEALMQDLRHQGIRVSILLPGSTNTTFGGKPAQANWKIQPEDLAQALLYLLSTDPRITPGQLEIRPSRPPSAG
jgi:3-oxoacyl-[acyl-carrier protein] reductase